MLSILMNHESEIWSFMDDTDELNQSLLNEDYDDNSQKHFTLIHKSYEIDEKNDWRTNIRTFWKSKSKSKAHKRLEDSHLMIQKPLWIDTSNFEISVATEMDTKIRFK